MAKSPRARTSPDHGSNQVLTSLRRREHPVDTGGRCQALRQLRVLHHAGDCRGCLLSRFRRVDCAERAKHGTQSGDLHREARRWRTAEGSGFTACGLVCVAIAASGEVSGKRVSTQWFSCRFRNSTRPIIGCPRRPPNPLSREAGEGRGGGRTCETTTPGGASVGVCDLRAVRRRAAFGFPGVMPAVPVAATTASFSNSSRHGIIP